MQREQIQSLGSRELDPGPPEFHFIITDTELLTGTMQELNRLREDKEKLEIQLHELQEKVCSAFTGVPLYFWGDFA